MSVRRKFDAAASGLSYFLIELTGFDSDFTFDSKLRSPLTGGAEILGVFGTVGVGFQFYPDLNTFCSNLSFSIFFSLACSWRIRYFCMPEALYPTLK